MSQFTVPEEWIETTLGEIIELKYGKSLPADKRDGEGFPVYGSNGVVGKHLEPLVPHAGIVVGRKGSYGEVHFSKNPFFPIDTTYFVDCFFEQPLSYWFYQLKLLPLTSLNRSTAIPGLNREDAYEQIIFLPPLAEQQQIAQKLDELLAQVDTLKIRLDAIPKILKRFRQSVLAAAVSGRLTEEWREKANSQNWIKVELLDVVQAKPRNGFSPQGVEYETQVKNLTLSATTSGVFKHDKYKYVDIEISDDSYLWLESDDILIQRANSLEYVGVSAIYTGKAKTYTYPDLMMKCRANEKVLTKFLHYSLSSSSARKYFQENATGTTGNMPKINQGVVCSLPINLPSIQEQTEIVRRVEQLFAYADQIEQRVKDAQARVNHLTQSILAKAFRGELTADWRAQNPELISGENSAAALLERIKAEREVGVKGKRKKHK